MAAMPASRPTSRSLLALTLLVLFFRSLLLQSVVSSPASDDFDDDLDGLEELLAIDAEEEAKGASGATGKLPEAEILSRARRFVLELSNANAGRVVDENQLVLLLGYTPWCQRSAELMPRFAEAATVLIEMGCPVLVAKLDAERHAKAAASLGIKGFPTVLLFVNGTALRYNGAFTAEEIVVWARKKTGTPLIRLSTKELAEEFLKQHHTFALGLFETFEGPEYEEFAKAAASDDEIQFVETDDMTLARLLFPDIVSETKFLGLVKRVPERFVKHEGAFEEERILQFVAYNKFPLVTALTDVNAAKIYSAPIKLQVFIFAEVDDFENLKPFFQEVARKYTTKILFVHTDSADDNLARPFLALFGLEPGSPIVTAFDNSIGSKHLMETDLTASNLEEFCSGLLQGTLSPYYRSEPNPTQKGLVEKIVSRTFDARVLESPENVFLEVYAPWCIDCEATSKLIEKLAKHFNGTDNLKFARIDASLNEHPKLQINNYPVLLFYAAGDKSNPINLSKKSSLKDLIGFIKGNMRWIGESNANQGKKDEL